MKIGIFDIQRFADISNSTSDTVVVGTSNADSIFNKAKNVTINAFGGNDTIKNGQYEFLSDDNYADNAVIGGGEGDDLIVNDHSDNVKINGDVGNDFIYNKLGHYVKIYGEDGNDTINNSGDNALVDGGSGNDSINATGEYVTLTGGAGDDYIYLIGSIFVNYDTASVNYNTSSDLESSADDSSLSIPDNYRYIISYVNNYNGMMLGDDGNDTIVAHDGNNITINGGAGNDILEGSVTRYNGSYNSNGYYIVGDYNKNFFIYDSGNDTIQNYESRDILNFAATYTDWTTDGNDLVINAAEGSVRSNEAQNKLIEIADANGNLISHVYLAQDYEGVIDGRGFGAFEVIRGSDNRNNQIYADAAGSSLWGGRGGSDDELYGNLGIDEYIYSYGNGHDNIFQSGGEDAVNLINMNLDQIAGAQILDNGVNLQFTDGGSLMVNGQVGTFKVGGQSYGADYQNKNWYAK